jgi:putative protease
MSKIQLELLSPAKDLECGITAINCGADAVYIGAPKFGARAAAGNSLVEISKLIDYAHKYWAKVYVTVNTIIYDEELEEVRQLITQLYNIGADAIIFQDMAILKMDIPPIQLFASTQTHNYELDRIKLLDAVGIKRIILARELSLEQIKKISHSVDAELEFFIHGALCVCLSGQCYLSQAMCGRSANRGECSQPCRLQYSLIDKNGKVIVSDKYLLSLRDLNFSAYLNDLITAGVKSFKIEGRLKDIDYVKNITAYYRQKIDSIIEFNSSLERSSSGKSIIPFNPDPDRTFNRGYTSYFIKGKDKDLSSGNSPKSTGKLLGKVTHSDKESFTIDTSEKIVNGDGLCFYNKDGMLLGMNVSKVNNNTVYSKELENIKKGMQIYRNHDHAFSNELKKDCMRNISATITIDSTKTGLLLTAIDENKNSASIDLSIESSAEDKTGKTQDIFIKQFSKSGGTIFSIKEVIVNISNPIFLSVSSINDLRRRLLSLLEQERLNKFPKIKSEVIKPKINQSKKQLNYKANIVNKLSEEFYKDLGAEEIEPGFELQKDYTEKSLMTCKYCIKDELGFCPKKLDKSLKEPLYLVQQNKKYKLVFNCKDCFMEIR